MSEREKRVCLDPGHDAGNLANKSPDGTYYEHAFTLDLGKRLEKLLTDRGVSVTMTRTGGGAVSLARRCEIANSIPDLDLFVSLHSNAAAGGGWSSAKGWSVYLYGPGGDRERAAQDILEQVRAAGIAVRAIAPHVASKANDSAVVVIDEAGRFAVPLLSGHLGGANELAQTVARAAGAIPVITTATDVRGVWAVDTWARCAGLAVSNPEAIKRVSARLLSGGRVALYSDMPISGQPPEGVDIASDSARADIVVSPFAGANAGASVRAAETTGEVVSAGETGKPAGVRAQAPAPEPLRLVVPCIVAGIGCRRGACAEAIGEAFLLACGQAGISPSAVRGDDRREGARGGSARLLPRAQYPTRDVFRRGVVAGRRQRFAI